MSRAAVRDVIRQFDDLVPAAKVIRVVTRCHRNFRSTVMVRFRAAFFACLCVRGARRPDALRRCGAGRGSGD